MLDPDFFVWSFGLPPGAKLTRRRGGKALLKQALESRLPESLLYRPKQGFGLPINEWFITGMAPFVEHALFSSPIRKRGFFDYDFIRSIWQQHLSGRVNYSFNIWSVLNLSLWYEHWIERRPFGIAEPPAREHRPGVTDQ
jgi:asparagine synthase (glutamine-hydrolysing)